MVQLLRAHHVLLAIQEGLNEPLIFLAWFKKLAPGRPTQIATSVIALNVLLLLAAATLIQGGAFKGDSAIPILFAVPSLLFLLHSSIGAWRSVAK